MRTVHADSLVPRPTSPDDVIIIKMEGRWVWVRDYHADADADLYFSIATPISAHKCLKCGPADTKISQVRLLNNCQAEGSRYSSSRLTYCSPFNLIDTRARDVLPSVQIPPHTITEPPPCFLVSCMHQGL